MTPVHTCLYLGLFAALYIFLAYRVTVFRRRERTSLGVRDHDSELTRAVRVHGNFAEHVPFALLLIGFSEMSGAPIPAVHGLAAILLVARLLHAYGLTTVAGRSPYRYWGTAGTFVVVLVAGGMATAVSTLSLAG